MRDILILTGNAGAGHMACSKALKAMLEERDKDVRVEIVDVFQFFFLGKQYDSVIGLLARSSVAKFLFDSGYKLINKYPFVDKIAYFSLLKPLYKKTLQFIKQKNPDLVVVNNPLVSEVVTRCRMEHRFKYVVTVTDIGDTISRWWASHNADLIFSPTEKTTKRLLEFSSECNVVTGYYSLRKVERFTSAQVEEFRQDFCKKASFSSSRPIILVTGSGLGTVKILREMRGFIKESEHQFIILTGRDQSLTKRLFEEFRDNERVFVQDFTDSVLELFSIVDVIIAKPGANTVLEIEKVGQRGIFTEPVGYQEVGNVDYLVKNPNFVYIGSDYSSIPKRIEEVLGKKRVEYCGEIKDAEDITAYILNEMQP